MNICINKFYYYYYYYYYPLRFSDFPLLVFFEFIRAINERKWDYSGNYCIILVLHVKIFNSEAPYLVYPLYFSKKTRFPAKKLQRCGK